jgi:undecaprenyl-diphosphatase
MNYLQIIILALIQGAAELLPVSSSAHVIVAERLMGLDPSAPEMTFLLVMLHTGTMFAVLCYFWPRWKALLCPAPEKEAAIPATRFVTMIILATAVTGVVGLGLKFVIENIVFVRLLGHSKGEVEELFRNLPLMAISLAVAGLLIIVAGWRDVRSDRSRLDGPTSLLIGLIQGLCLPFRGFSRSGSTISTGLLRSVPRGLAEDFSFALAVVLTPPVIFLELRRLVKNQEWQGTHELMRLLQPGLVGMVFSFAAGLIALRVLSAALERGRWRYFGYYCLVAATGIAFLALRIGS